MKNLIGKKVQLKKRYAKWHLEHPEIYSLPLGGVDNSYEPETLMHLMCLFDVPVTGVVTGRGHLDCYGVAWKVAGIKSHYYIDPKDFTVL